MDYQTTEKPRLIVQENSLQQDLPSLTLSDEHWTIKLFKKKFRVVLVRTEEKEIEFDLIGLSPAIANAFRRTMISDVPTMAIDQVCITNNTSVMQDEILAHRLGLIPLKANPQLFDFKNDPSEENSENNSLEYQLKIRCSHNREYNGKSSHPEEKYLNSSVYSKHIEWIPIGNQKDTLSKDSVGPVDDDILIMKLRPGHEIDVKLTAFKGVGKDHAKFQPAACVSYRMCPEITLKRPVEGEDAEALQSCFSPGVIEVVEENNRKYAKVKNARYDSGSRNVFRHDHLKDAVVINRVQNHFIFNIESHGALEPETIFREAVAILRNKGLTLLEELRN